MLFIPHGAPAQNRHLGHGLLLQHLQRATTWSQQFPHKVELKIDFLYHFWRHTKTNFLMVPTNGFKKYFFSLFFLGKFFRNLSCDPNGFSIKLRSLSIFLIVPPVVQQSWTENNVFCFKFGGKIFGELPCGSNSSDYKVEWWQWWAHIRLFVTSLPLPLHC
jgi:hypothetical protein